MTTGSTMSMTTEMRQEIWIMMITVPISKIEARRKRFMFCATMSDMTWQWAASLDMTSPVGNSAHPKTACNDTSKAPPVLFTSKKPMSCLTSDENSWVRILTVTLDIAYMKQPALSPLNAELQRNDSLIQQASFKKVKETWRRTTKTRFQQILQAYSKTCA